MLTEEIKEALEEVCKGLKLPQFNPYQFINRHRRRNPEAVLHALQRLKLRVDAGIPFKRNPWAYATKILAVEDGNYNERDFCKRVEVQHGKDKKMKCPRCKAMREFLVEVHGQKMCHNCLIKGL